eukprot:187118_1
MVNYPQNAAAIEFGSAQTDKEVQHVLKALNIDHNKRHTLPINAQIFADYKRKNSAFTTHHHQPYYTPKGHRYHSLNHNKKPLTHATALLQHCPFMQHQTKSTQSDSNIEKHIVTTKHIAQNPLPKEEETKQNQQNTKNIVANTATDTPILFKLLI